MANDKECEGCLEYDDFTKMVNVDKLNEFIGKTMSEVTGFLNTYETQQDQIKQKLDKKLDEDRYRATAIKIKRDLIEEHKREMNRLNGMNNLYKEQDRSVINLKDLLEMLERENKILVKKMLDEENTINLSDRKTWYENNENETVNWWKDLLSKSYWVMVIGILIAILFKGKYKDIRYWIFLILIFVFPPLAYFIIDVIGSITGFIWDQVKNIYLYL